MSTIQSVNASQLKYCNPNSKRKQRRANKRMSNKILNELKNTTESAEIIRLFDDVKVSDTPDQIAKSLDREKHSRTEPDSYQKEKPLSNKLVGAVGKNRTEYGSKPPHGMPHRSALDYAE